MSRSSGKPFQASRTSEQQSQQLWLLFAVLDTPRSAHVTMEKRVRVVSVALTRGYHWLCRMWLPIWLGLPEKAEGSNNKELAGFPGIGLFSWP